MRIWTKCTTAQAVRTETAGNDWLHAKHRNMKHTTQPQHRNLLSHFTDTAQCLRMKSVMYTCAQNTPYRAQSGTSSSKKCDGDDDGTHCRWKKDHRCVGGSCNSSPYGPCWTTQVIIASLFPIPPHISPASQQAQSHVPQDACIRVHQYPFKAAKTTAFQCEEHKKKNNGHRRICKTTIRVQTLMKLFFKLKGEKKKVLGVERGLLKHEQFSLGDNVPCAARYWHLKHTHKKNKPTGDTHRHTRVLHSAWHTRETSCFEWAVCFQSFLPPPLWWFPEARLWKNSSFFSSSVHNLGHNAKKT